MKILKQIEHWLFEDFEISIVLLILYAVLAYEITPYFWRHHNVFHERSNLSQTTHTIEGLKGDPLNLFIIGDRSEIVHSFLKAGWYPADPITLNSAAHIAYSTLAKKAYSTAPVSNLYLWDRKQDLAFELCAEGSPKKRHHIRLWLASSNEESFPMNRELWVGAATFDETYGFSHFTGQITHHIDPDIDKERELVIDSLKSTDQIAKVYSLTFLEPILKGKNGGGDFYYSDGLLKALELNENINGIVQASSIKEINNTLPIEIKSKFWNQLKSFK